MLLKFFSQVNGNDEPGGLDYVLKNKTARVLRGSVEITRAVIDSSPPNLAQRFTSGVVNNVSEQGEDKDEMLLDELELQLLGGRPKESMPWCVVEHTDKMKREKHFIVPIYDLVFEKHVHPYIDRIDQKGFEAWVEHFNLRHGVVPPGHRLRVEPDFKHLNFKIDAGDIEFLRLVWERVKIWVENKEVMNRIELEARLVTEGYRVRCNTHGGQPLAQPHIMGPSGKWLRLKGSIYYRPEFGVADVKPLDLADKKAVKDRLAELREIMFDRYDFRAYHLIGRLFGRKEQERVTLGKARQHFERLIEKKMMETRCESLAEKHVDYGYLARVLSLADSGLDLTTSPHKGDEAASTQVPPPTVKFKLISAAETEAVIPASDAFTVKTAEKAPDSEIENSEFCPATPMVDGTTIVGAPGRKSPSTGKTGVRAEAKAPEPVVSPILSAVDSSEFKGDESKSHTPPEAGRTQFIREEVQQHSIAKKSVPAKKRRKLKEFDDTPQIGGS